jgi:hypothetical protein
MAEHDPLKSKGEDQLGDDFRKIAGIGQALERRLHDAGILTYQDLAARSPDQIAALLADVAGVSSARIASQDWTGQARQLAGPLAPPLPSEPSQHYASFNVELLLDGDDSVRRTKVHHYQSDTDYNWSGWDENQLLARLRDHISLAARSQPTEAIDRQSAAPPTSEPETAAPPAGQPEITAAVTSLPSSMLRIDELCAVRDGERSRILTPGEPTSVRLAVLVNRTGTPQAATLDVAADITAHSMLGDNQRWPLGTTQGAISVDEPLSVELAGRPLPPGLYRLVATVVIYPAGHTPESQPLYSRRRSGALIQVADAPAQTAPGTDLTPSRR